MGIAKFDDGIPDNPKHIAAGAQACWLWFCSVLYCRRALTDGFIPKAKVPTLSIGLSSPFKYAARLVEVGLWDDAMGGYQVHDYLEWNPSKAVVEEYRRKDKERKHRQNPDRIPEGFHSGSGVDSERRGASHVGAKSKSTSEPTSEDLDFSGESAREGPAPVWTNRPSSRHGGLIGSHLRCFNGPGGPAACARGLCVPNWLGQQWTQQYGDDRQRADREIAAFIAAMLDGIPPGPIGDLGKDFWPAAWKATHGSQAPRASMTRTGDTVDAGKRFLAKRFAQLKAEEGDAHVVGQIES